MQHAAVPLSGESSEHDATDEKRNTSTSWRYRAVRVDPEDVHWLYQQENTDERDRRWHAVVQGEDWNVHREEEDTEEHGGYRKRPRTRGNVVVIEGYEDRGGPPPHQYTEPEPEPSEQQSDRHTEGSHRRQVKRSGSAAGFRTGVRPLSSDFAGVAYSVPT
ncbi:hypothetical protein GCM10009037_08540 [Halarchaeum grantii]|uniref:Uncharacterized protein n=1 Tax=Halarchaeum grantii TaxID=1193105 RepID=A0A830ET63_9EURY|nr:hypothetical protein GCM10009037_08540 [Halarchaeum grantii]